MTNNPIMVMTLLTATKTAKLNIIERLLSFKLSSIIPSPLFPVKLFRQDSGILRKCHKKHQKNSLHLLKAIIFQKNRLIHIVICM